VSNEKREAARKRVIGDVAPERYGLASRVFDAAYDAALADNVERVRELEDGAKAAMDELIRERDEWKVSSIQEGRAKLAELAERKWRVAAESALAEARATIESAGTQLNDINAAHKLKAFSATKALKMVNLVRQKHLKAPK